MPPDRDPRRRRGNGPGLPSQRGRKASKALPTPRFGAAAFGAVVVGTAGFYGGLLLSGSSSGTLAGAAVGAILGQAMGAPLGAHVFNAGRGSLLADLGVSAGWIAAGVLLGSAIDGAETEI